MGRGVKSLGTPRFLRGRPPRVAAKRQRSETREKDNEFDTQSGVHPGGNDRPTTRSIDVEPRREPGKRFRFRGYWSRLTIEAEL